MLLQAAPPCNLALPQVEVSRAETVHELVGHASRARSTGSTGVNEDSSRSHSIMQVNFWNTIVNVNDLFNMI